LAGRVIVVGGDGELAAVKRIKAGTQTATIKKDSEKIATPVVKMIDGILKDTDPGYNKDVDNGFKKVPSVQVSMTVVDSSNLQEEFINSGIFTAAQLTD
jgi:D-xylose transport system substrate-binding protein